MWPGPITGDGTTFENMDNELSIKSMEQALTMQRSLNIKPETDPGSNYEYIREKLLNHAQKDFWHPKNDVVWPMWNWNSKRFNWVC